MSKRHRQYDVEIFLDLANVCCAWRALGFWIVPLGSLAKVAVREFARRLGLVTPADCLGDGLEPSVNVRCHHVWCVAKHPVNVHPDDRPRMHRASGFLRFVQRRYGFILVRVPVDYRYQRLVTAGDQRPSSDLQTSSLHAEKGVDVRLATLMVRRAMDPSPPQGMILLSGDADFAPALELVGRLRPPVTAMAAGFANSLSSVYQAEHPTGYHWRFPPIVLDEFIPELTRHDPQGCVPQLHA